MNTDIKKAIEVLNNGGIIIYPTDTAYAIGCRIDKQDSINRLFKIRNRPLSQAVPVLVDGIGMAGRYLEPVPEDVKKLMEQYWPGQLTIVYSCNQKFVPKLIRGGGLTLGARMPENKTALSIIKGVGVPVLGPSANFSGGQTPYSFENLDPELLKLVDFVVPGGNLGQETSTVIDCSVVPWKVLRQGATKVKSEKLKVKSYNSNFKKVVLYINTSKTQEVRVKLTVDGRKFVKSGKSVRGSQSVLAFVDELLKKANIGLKDINEVKVNIGPGSFTGLRVGIAIANALGFGLQVKVNGKTTGELAEPKY